MRNYKKESKWQKEKYGVIKAYVDKDLATKFKEQLKKDNITIADFIKKAIKEYLK